MTEPFRTEVDSMGEMRVPAGAYYGAQTARAAQNFPISGIRMPRELIRALGLIKKHAAAANQLLGELSPKLGEALTTAAQEVVDGKLDGEFVVDVFQTGSGTSTNMNANEVIANRAAELLGSERGSRAVHPNDHVNRGQSSNDVIPTAIHLAALEGITCGLLPALQELHLALLHKAVEFRDVMKIGRTHLQDATPMHLGQEFSGYARQIEQGIERLHNVENGLGQLALGGTAVGTGINTHAEFARRTIAGIAQETGLRVREAPNHFAAQGAIDALVEASGLLKGVALSLMKIANDLRLLGSGPRCGLGELKLPAVQPGSSIMPGKVNPVMSEMVVQVAAQVVGNDLVITLSASQGWLELNTMLPVAAHSLLQSIRLLTSGANVFRLRCVEGLEADRERCEANVERSLALGTALVPAIGYDRAASIVKEAFESGRKLREVAVQRSGLSPEQLEELLDPRRQTRSTHT
jgi:fumarate hydratase, class II